MRKYSFFTALVCFHLLLAVACSSVPEADFYESEGVVSVGARSPGLHHHWQTHPYGGAIPLLSVESGSGENGEILFPFYIQEPGEYGIWLLGGRQGAEEPIPLSARVLDSESFLLEHVRLMFTDSTGLQWVNRDENGEAATVFFEDAGHYQIIVDSGGRGGWMVSKLHLSLNNAVLPEGTGLPETRDPEFDAVQAKIDQPEALPLAWLFSGIAVGTAGPHPQVYSFSVGPEPDAEVMFSERREVAYPAAAGADSLHTLYKQSREFQPEPDQARGLVMVPFEKIDLQNPEFKRYPAQWTAGGFREQLDIVSNPRNIAYEIPFLVNLPPSDPVSEEEFLRWLQFSVFHSVMTLPYEVPDHLSESVKNEIANLARLRQRLFPYAYSLAHRVRATGEKPVTGDANRSGQYRYGDAFLVHPLAEEETGEHRVWLPEGTWYDYWNGTAYRGEQTWIIESSAGSIPVFVKAGSIIPYLDVPLHREPGGLHSLFIDIYAGGTGTFRLYEDDGWSEKYRDGEFATTALRYFEREDYSTLTVGATVGEFENQPVEKTLTMRIRQPDAEPQRIEANGEELSMGTGVGKWSYSSTENVILIQWLQSKNQKTDFRIRY